MVVLLNRLPQVRGGDASNRGGSHAMERPQQFQGGWKNKYPFGGFGPGDLEAGGAKVAFPFFRRAPLQRSASWENLVKLVQGRFGEKTGQDGAARSEPTFPV